MTRANRINALRFVINKAFDALADIDIEKTKVVWFGLTNFVDIIQKALISKGRRIHYIVDNAPEKWGRVLENDLVVFPVQQIVNNYKENAVFLISSRFKDEMRRQLADVGVAESDIKILPYHDECEDEARKFLLKQTDGLKQANLRETQLIMLDSLKIFRDFCETNGLRYFLAAGTLLGAVRHKGFIPWDDDADVYLPDSDYWKFIEIFPDGGRYGIADWKKKDDMAVDFAKFYDYHTIKITAGYPVKMLTHVALCVFPLCGYPDDASEFQNKLHRNKALDFKWYQYQNSKDVISDEPQDARRDICELKYNMPFDGSPLIGRTHLMHKPMWSVPRSVFEDSVPVEFEGELFSAPAGYDAYLKAHYRDYMRLPPEDERINHGTAAFWKREGSLSC